MNTAITFLTAMTLVSLTTESLQAQPPVGPVPRSRGHRPLEGRDPAAETAIYGGIGLGFKIAEDAAKAAIHGKEAAPPVAFPAEASNVDLPTPVAPILAALESKLISVLDRNHDGIIDEEEILLASASLKKLDLNKDGKLTADEFLTLMLQEIPASPLTGPIRPVPPFVPRHPIDPHPPRPVRPTPAPVQPIGHSTPKPHSGGGSPAQHVAGSPAHDGPHGPAH
jgi:hypothetical protein